MTAIDVHVDNVAIAANGVDLHHDKDNNNDGTALVATDNDTKAFMQLLLYGQSAGWGSDGAGDAQSVHAVGYKGLLEQVLRARRYHNNDNSNNNSSSGEGDSSEVQALIAETRASYLAAEQQLLGDDTAAATGTGTAAAAAAAGAVDAGVVAVRAATGGGLLHCPDWMMLRDRFFDAAALLATAGCVDDAARCFLHATYINRALHDDEEAHTTLSLSVEQLAYTHPALAADALVRLARSCDGRGLLWQAARCRKEAAELHETKLDDKPGAITLYRAAMATYDKTSLYGMQTTLREACLKRLCYLHVALEQYVEAEALLLAQARATSSRRLPATRFYLYATLCRLARGYHDGDDEKDDKDAAAELQHNNNNNTVRSGSYNSHVSHKPDRGSEAFFDALYDTRKLFLALQDEDVGYQSGKENELVRSLLAACDAGALRDVDLAVMQYKAYKTTVPSVVFDMLCERCRNNVYAHIERFA